jgi:uncharacterized protein (DUF697 family)
MYGWLRRTFGRKATKTAGREVSQEVSQEVGEATTKSTVRRIAPVAAVGGVVLFHDEIAEGIGSGIASLGKGAVNTVFDSPVMVGVGLLMVGGIFYAIFK